MPHVELPQAEFKVVMLGDTCTGKTSLVLRFAEGYYRESARSATVGAFFITKRMTVQGLTCKIQIWDTAGQEQFKKLAPMYYKNAAAAVICYDVSSPQSFDTLRYWVNELQTNLPADGIVIALCATKGDLINTAEDTIKAEALAAEIGALFVCTSAKDNMNVNELFEKVTERVLHLQQNEERTSIPVNMSNTTIDMYDSVMISPTKGGFADSCQTPRIAGNGYSSQKDRQDKTVGKSTVVDEKKEDDEEGVVDVVESRDTVESKCDASRLMCGDTEELMGGSNGNGCVIL